MQQLLKKGKKGKTRRERERGGVCGCESEKVLFFFFFSCAKFLTKQSDYYPLTVPQCPELAMIKIFINNVNSSCAITFRFQWPFRYPHLGENTVQFDQCKKLAFPNFPSPDPQKISF